MYAVSIYVALQEDFAKIKLPKFDPKPKPEEKEPVSASGPRWGCLF